jgi:uncharacterized membrane protein (UPF0127 family)
MIRFPFVFVSIAAMFACNRAPDAADTTPPMPVVAFDTGRVRIETATDTITFTVELAENDEQRTHGLMERPQLAEDAGMVFLYNQPQDASAGFWMFRTLIPLDIAFFDSTGRIVSILSMEPCASPNPGVCRTYPAGAAYSGALEVNAGTFAKHGIRVGDRIVVEAGSGGAG